MKKNVSKMLLIALVGIAMVIVIVGLSMEASNKEEQVSNLWLQNIEALVSGEGSSTVFCYGEGSVLVRMELRRRLWGT